MRWRVRRGHDPADFGHPRRVRAEGAGAIRGDDEGPAVQPSVVQTSVGGWHLVEGVRLGADGSNADPDETDAPGQFAA